MRSLPRSKSLIIIFSSILIFTMAIAIALRFIAKEPEKQLIKLKKANFETYFNVETSYSQINESAFIKYSFTPKQDYASKSQSGQTIKVTLAVSFYKYSSTSGTPIKTEYIYINLLKSKDFKKKSSGSVEVPQNAKGYKIYVSYANGTIYA